MEELKRWKESPSYIVLRSPLPETVEDAYLCVMCGNISGPQPDCPECGSPLLNFSELNFAMCPRCRDELLVE